MRLVWLGVVASVVATSGWAQAKGPIDLTAVRMVDLSHELAADAPAWPGLRFPFRLDTVVANDRAAMFNVFTPEHFGTHLDAPRHASGTGLTTERVPLDRLIAPAVVVDVTAAVGQTADYQVSPADLARHEARHGRITPGSFVLIKTGWAVRWGQASYFGAETSSGKTVLHFPSLGVEAARVLVERGVAGVGVDCPSTDYGAAPSFDVHGVLGAAGIPAIENLADLSEVPATGAVVVALPPKIKGGSGGPIRVVALIPKSR